MNLYPFIIRGPTRKRLVHAEGRNFFNALEKVLSVYPAKFVNYKNAKAMDLINVKKKVIALSKSNKGVEHKIWLDKEGDFYISFLNPAGHTMLVEEETNDAVEIGSARLNKFDLQSTWLNGEQQAEPEQIEKPKKQKITKSKNKEPMKTKSKKAVKTAKKETKEVTGKKVTITIAEVRKAHAAGKTIRNLKGTKYTPGYIKNFKDATRKVGCVVEG